MNKIALIIGGFLLITTVVLGIVFLTMKKENYSSAKCTNAGGSCINVNTESCSGTVQSGLCPGPSNIKCCVASAPASSTSSATNEGSACKTDWGGYAGSLMGPNSTCYPAMAWDSGGVDNNCCIQGYKYNAPTSSTPAGSASSGSASSGSASAGATSGGWTTLPADAMAGGYTTTQLRYDIAPYYLNLYNAVHALGGAISSAGGKRALDAEVNSSRSSTSLHYLGRAFDLATYSGMQNVDKDRFICVPIDSKHWTVWCKTDNPSVPVVTLVGAEYKSGKVSTRSWVGKAINFTAMAIANGFKPIGARSSFLTGTYMSAEWWHFQFTGDLVAGTTFGSELLKIYSLSTLEGKYSTFWNRVKNLKYGSDWS